MGELKWLLPAVGLLVLGLLIGSQPLAFAMYACAATIVIARGMSRSWLAGLAYSRTCNRSRANVRDLVAVSLRVTNKGRFPIPWVLLEDTVPEDFELRGERGRVAFLRAGQSVNLLYQIRMRRRGYHRIGPIVAETGDFFGLYRRFRVGTEADYVTVFPKVRLMYGVEMPSRRPLGESRISLRSYEDPSRLAGVREYVRGDRLNRIHWKVTAKTGKLHSKIFDPTVVRGATVILDFHQGSYEGEEGFERSELAVTIAASVCYDVFMSGEQVGLLTNGRDAAERVRLERQARQLLSRQRALQAARSEITSHRLMAVHVPAGRRADQGLRILQTLARLELSDGLPLHGLLLDEARRFARDMALAVVAPRVEPELAQCLVRLHTAGFPVQVFLAAPSTKELDEANMLLINKNIWVHRLRNEEDVSDLSRKGVPR